MRLCGTAFLPVAFLSLRSVPRPMGNYLFTRSLPRMHGLPPRQLTILEYIQEFIERTNDGRVFTLDTSTLDTSKSIVLDKMTYEEQVEREEWETNRSDLLTLYEEKHYALVEILGKKLTPEEVLLLRVAPPFLNDRAIAARSKLGDGRDRLYLDHLGVWEDFKSGVRSFTVPAVVQDKRVAVDVLYLSLEESKRLTNEVSEGSYIESYVLQKLQDAGLLEHRDQKDALTLESVAALGRADHFLMAGGNTTVPIEFKSTQNLLLPEEAGNVTCRYNKAVEEVKSIKDRTNDWANIGHPLAQLILYMFVGKSRYGVLSSGTRTYFLKVMEGTDADPRVLITDAWFIGREDYLRAWSYLYQMATRNGDFRPPDDWKKKWPPRTRRPSRDRDQPGKRKRGGGRQRGRRGPPTNQFMTWLDPGVGPSIPRVDGHDVEFVRFLGAGRNQVYAALWKGKEVAVKVFDIDEDLELFEKEIRAYEHLKDAWGVLIPEPYFIAEKSVCFVLLGMQLGRPPNSNDTEINSDQKMLSRTLRNKYDFDHLDLHPGNVIYIPDKRGKGKDHLVAIDLELHEILL